MVLPLLAAGAAGLLLGRASKKREQERKAKEQAQLASPFAGLFQQQAGRAQPGQFVGSQGLANPSAQLAFRLSGQSNLPFANPNVVLRNAGFLGNAGAGILA